MEADRSDQCIKEIRHLVGISFEGKEDCVRKALRKIRRDLILQMRPIGRGPDVVKR